MVRSRISSMRDARNVTRRTSLQLGVGAAAAIVLAPCLQAEAASDFIPRYEIPAHDGDLPPLPRTWTKVRPPWRTGRGRRNRSE
jgi:hypothetical protein